MAVILLLAVIWAAVLVPPAVRSRQSRRKAFEISFGRAVPAPVEPATPPRRFSPAVQRRRWIAGGLLVAMAATGLVGLLPTFRTLLVVHLFLDDSFLFYVALLVHRAQRQAGGASRPVRDVAPVYADLSGVKPAGRLRRTLPRPAMLPDLPPIASIG